MYGCSDGKYTRPDPIDISNPTRRASTRFSSTASVGQSSNLTTESPWRPKRSNLSNVYIPKNRSEEIVLSLILSEYIAGKDAVLSQVHNFCRFTCKRRKELGDHDLVSIAGTEIFA